MLPFTSGWRMMNGPSAAVMFSAPKRWGLAGFLGGCQYSVAVSGNGTGTVRLQDAVDEG